MALESHDTASTCSLERMTPDEIPRRPLSICSNALIAAITSPPATTKSVTRRSAPSPASPPPPSVNDRIVAAWPAARELDEPCRGSGTVQLTCVSVCLYNTRPQRLRLSIAGGKLPELPRTSSRSALSIWCDGERALVRRLHLQLLRNKLVAGTAGCGRAREGEKAEVLTEMLDRSNSEHVDARANGMTGEESRRIISGKNSFPRKKRKYSLGSEKFFFSRTGGPLEDPVSILSRAAVSSTTMAPKRKGEGAPAGRSGKRATQGMRAGATHQVVARVLAKLRCLLQDARWTTPACQD